MKKVEDWEEQVHIDGNTVRKTTVKVDVQKPFEEHKKQINKRITGGIKESGISPIFAVGILVAAVIILTLCVDYIQLQTDIKVRLDNINSMEAELAELIAGNNVLEKQVNSYIDLDYVYEVATTELGMRYPTNSQVVYYESSNPEYVRQYGYISENGAN